MSNTPFSNYTLDKIPQELYLFYGGFAGTEGQPFDPLADSFFSQRIPEKNRRLVTTKTIWQANKTYQYYTPSSYDIVWNDDNGIVYLCLHNNSNFRNDTGDGEPGLSTIKPSLTGKFTTADGYTWLSLWKVDYLDYDFINDTEIPIPDVEPTTNYDTFTEKYEPLCGSAGTTAFGCCCLYFKDNSTDEVTGEVYTKGDLTNEVIFSDCFECQKLADALDRDVLFLRGITVGGVTSSHPAENPLCPATKTIQTLQAKLEEDVYNITTGSAKDFQLDRLQNHAKQGIMLVSLDLDGLTETQRSINTSNPTVIIADALGSGAVATIKTTPIGLDKHYVYGIELVSEGSGYSLLPTPSAAISSTILDAISIYPYPEKIYEDLQLFTPATGLRILNTITNKQIATVITTSTLQVLKAAVVADPKNYQTGSPVIKTKNDATISTLLTEVFAFDPTTFEEGGAVPEGGGGPGYEHENAAGGFGNEIPSLDTEYVAYVVDAEADVQEIVYNGTSGTADGYILRLNDDPASFTIGEAVNVGGTRHIVYNVDAPIINSKSAKFYNTIDLSGTPIGITQEANRTTLKSYTFNIKLNN
jgi:hypothetical protein